MDNLTQLNRKAWAVQLPLATGLALLFLAALLWGLQGATPARADPGTRYVDGAAGSDTTDCSNPAAPCETIRYALAQATNGDEIRVAEGIYTETLDIIITVTLRGGYTLSGTLWLPHTGETIVDANGADDAAIWIYPNTNVTVEGLAVQGANHTGDEGGGFFIDRATVVVSNTVVRNNSAAGGAGMYVEKWQGYPGSLSLINSSLLTNTASQQGGGLSSSGWPTVTLDNVEVRANTAQGGGGGLSVGRVTITTSRIVSNTAGGSGGGIAATLAQIYNSEISGNEANGAGVVFGGGIAMGAGGRLAIRDSIVSHNRAVGGSEGIAGGISAENTETTIANTIVSGNSAQFNAGLSLYRTLLTMTNSLVISNTGSGVSGDPVTGTIVNVTVADNTWFGMQIGGAVSITNSVMWGNGGASDYVCSGGCTLAYSDVGNGDTTGVGNITADPRFVDALEGDYHLAVGSPCIDKGTPVGAPTLDIEGTSRDAAPDMGAYEWAGLRIFLPLALRSFGP